MTISPQVRQTPTGWLAISAPSDRFHIAVPGATAEEAAANLQIRQAFWDEMRGRPEPEPSDD